MLKQRHVADFETYVLVLYTALSDLTIAPPFIPPIAKTGNVLSSLFFCFKWGALVHVDLVFYGAKFGVLRACFLLCGAEFGSATRGLLTVDLAGDVVAVCD